MKMMIQLSIAASLLMATSCNGDGGNSQVSGGDSATQETQASTTPQFDADSAYEFTAAQCAFGPRVPGTAAHKQCGDMLEARLRQWAHNVIVQNGDVTTFDGNKFKARNIIAQFNPDAKGRILLLAHWDCRPWADKDEDPAKHKEPVMGANDAASGVAVLLEVARQLKAHPTDLGVDILLCDVEDWGEEDDEDSWALGTQYWARNMHVKGYQPMYGILLDMVGAQGAQFAPEYFSASNAPQVVRSVWQAAASAGYSSYFRTEGGGAVTDDHIAVNQAGIPCIDIIDMRASGFFDGWHTTHDTMDNIDRNTLKAVGQTLLQVIYE